MRNGYRKFTKSHGKQLLYFRVKVVLRTSLLIWKNVIGPQQDGDLKTMCISKCYVKRKDFSWTTTKKKNLSFVTKQSKQIQYMNRDTTTAQTDLFKAQLKNDEHKQKGWPVFFEDFALHTEQLYCNDDQWLS